MMDSRDTSKDVHNIINDDGDDAHEDALPGFRFHPTDEELVAFYLRRKLEKKPFSIELIKQIDIYKHEPWDLPKYSSTVGEREWYFFCKRGRKYRNSIRPNRVTGSGFWKATGIDKPVYSQGGEGHDCIGLKKTLVYYRGSAGKGTKTDWMMHEFRLPYSNDKFNTIAKNTNGAQEAEIWTLCRVFKRSMTNRKYIPDWRELAAKRTHSIDKNNNKAACSIKFSNNQESYISFDASNLHHHHHEQKPIVNYYNDQRTMYQLGQFNDSHPMVVEPQPHPTTSSSSFLSPDHSNELFTYGSKWDELGSVVQSAFDRSLM